jgi:hypothetical protein
VVGAFSFDCQVPAEGLYVAICVGKHVGELGIGVMATTGRRGPVTQSQYF